MGRGRSRRRRVVRLGAGREDGQRRVGDLAEDGFAAVRAAAEECARALWSLVPDWIREPVGEPGGLRRGATAWRTLAGDVRDAAGRAGGAGRGLGAAVEGDRYDALLAAIGDQVGFAREVADGAEDLAGQLDTAAGAIEEVNGLVHAILIEIGATLAIGAVMGLLTGGGGAVVGSARVAVLVGRATAAVDTARGKVRSVAATIGVVDALRAPRVTALLRRTMRSPDDVARTRPRQVPGALIRVPARNAIRRRRRPRYEQIPGTSARVRMPAERRRGPAPAPRPRRRPYVTTVPDAQLPRLLRSDARRKRPAWRKADEERTYRNAKEGRTGGRRCARCRAEVHWSPGMKRDWDIDHVDAWAGRRDDLLRRIEAGEQITDAQVDAEYRRDLQLLCWICNKAKGAD